jgi:hypothetical protein
MEAIKLAIKKMNEQERFEVIKLLEGTFYMPVVITKDYLETLLEKEVDEKFMIDMNANSDINDAVLDATHYELQKKFNK